VHGAGRRKNRLLVAMCGAHEENVFFFFSFAKLFFLKKWERIKSGKGNSSVRIELGHPLSRVNKKRIRQAI
jgi:hypothetical protein